MSDTTDGYTPTTTHAEFGAGNPRLRVTRDGDRTEFALDVDLVRIGSADGNELRLADTDPLHATVQHDDRDEYVLTLHGDGEKSSSSVSGATHPGDDSQTLRTGASFTAGPWTFVFAREEFADHGRPFGGRKGGEYDDQQLQAPRPDYSADAEQSASASTDSPQAEPAPDDYNQDGDQKNGIS
jgi:hypothetical protein